MSNRNLILAAAGQVGGDYQISRSLRFNQAEDTYLNRTPASAGNRKTWTLSFWVKRSFFNANNQHIFGATSDSYTSNYVLLSFLGGPDERLRLSSVGHSPGYELLTTQRFRDVSAWYNFVIAFDTTQATDSNRIKFYVNGSQITAFDSATYPTLNLDSFINNNIEHTIGIYVSNRAPNGYLADIHLIDGQQLTPSSFGETDAVTGVWKPIRYAGTYGTNGFHLPFSDNSDVTATTLGKDTSGNGNNWTPNNFYVGPGSTQAEKAGIDSLVDSPTRYGTDTGAGGEVRGNYCTLNPVFVWPFTGDTISNGNLDVANIANTQGFGHGTIGVTSGKYYFEMLVGTSSGYTDVHLVGWQVASPAVVNRGTYRSNGTIYDFAGSTTSGSTYTTNDIIGCAVDVDAGKVWFAKNNTWQNSGDPAAGTNEAFTFTAGTEVFPAFVLDNQPNSITATFNFGQRPFAYTAPSGFKALVTTNLPDPTVVQGDDYFNTVLYQGDGTTQSVTGVGFQPDWVWIKNRDAAYVHVLFDVVRGSSGGYFNKLVTSSDGSESLYSQGAFGAVTSLNSDGFTVDSSNSDWNQTNASGTAYVAWNWKANGAGSSNTDGTITSTVSANQTAGISIVTWTNTNTSSETIGHGLGLVPAMIILKFRSSTSNWSVYHKSLGPTKRVTLNTTAAENTGSDFWNDTAPTTSVFSIGSGLNQFTYTNSAIVFAEVEGFSKFGSYTGNGSTDGPFVYTGFRPAWVLIKRTSGTLDYWTIFDSARSPSNVIDEGLFPNSSGSESSGSAYNYDFLSNGFKVRSSDSYYNASGSTYIFACFSSNPFKTSLAR